MIIWRCGNSKPGKPPRRSSFLIWHLCGGNNARSGSRIAGHAPENAPKAARDFALQTPEQRYRLCLEQSAYLIRLSRAELETRMSPIEARIEWVRINYGERIAVGYRQALHQKGHDV